MKLLPQELLVKTGPVDHADWNYRPLLGLILRSRYAAVCDMLRGHTFHRLLELGYGSGVFMPELASHAKQLYGVDVHTSADAVSHHLEQVGTHAQLCTADVESLPYPDRYFQCVVAVSVCEFFHDLGAACGEIARVLSEDGVFVVITPASSAVLDAGLRILTGESARRDFGDRRRELVPTLRRKFTVVAEYPIGKPFVRFYTALKLCQPGRR